MTKRYIAPIHLGEALLNNFMKPLELNQYALAKAMSVPPRRINEIVHEKRAITGGSTVIQAMGQGRIAARAMHEYLTAMING